MAKENKKAPAKQANKSNQTTKTPKAPKAPKAPAEAPVVETQTAETPAVNAGTVINAMTGHLPGGLDANRRVDLNGQIIKMFHDDPRARQNLGDAICDAMDDIARCGIICALADEAANGTSTFAQVIKSSQYPALVVAANQMGITLPSLKALPAGEEEDTVVVEPAAVTVSPEAKQQLTEEQAIEKAGDAGEIILEPEKVAELGEEDLIKALKYKMITGPKRMKLNKFFTDIVDFMHDYRIALARKAENSTDAMNEIEDRSMYSWLKEIFGYIEPTFLISGIGKGMRVVIARDKAPLAAFLILRRALTDRETGVVAWDDQSIADATKAIVELVCHAEIAKAEAKLEDPEIQGHDKQIELLKKEIEDNKEVVNNLTGFTYDICEKYLTEEGSKNQALMNLYGQILVAYYPLCDCQGSHFVNLLENLRQRAGIILNLFREAGNSNQNYSEDNLLDVYVCLPQIGIKHSLEEWAAMGKNDKEVALNKEEMKQKASAEKKEESKNA